MQNNIGKKLRAIRKKRGLSTLDLSKTSQVHQTTISAIENGKHNSPGIGTIERLSQALKISPLYFFGKRIFTPFDLMEDAPEELTDFLLSEDSLPYLMLSKKAYERGISSETIKKLLSIIQETIDEKEMV